MKPMFLFVDDEESVLNAIQYVLRSREHEWDMIFTTDSMEALDFVRKMFEAGSGGAEYAREFAIIVSDVQMPGINGIEFFEVLHTIFPDTIRILLTGNTDSGFAIRAINEGKVHRYLLKSCIIDELIPEMESAYREYFRVKAQREEAYAAKRAKAVFLDTMTHEIRTPLNGVMGMLQLLKETGLTLEQMEYVQAAMDASRRLTKLFNNVLDYSRFDSGQVETPDVAFRIGDVMRHLNDALSGKAKSKGVAFTCTVDERVPERVYGKESLLRQVLYHLAENAVKFTDSGAVAISATLLPHAGPRFCRILFAIEDSGCGIPDEKLLDVFQPFTQVDDSYIRPREGAGLGLSLVQKLLKIMDASGLAVENGPCGVTVCLSAAFRVWEQPLPLAAPGAPSGSAVPAAGKILLVAREALAARRIKKALLLHGFDVDAAVDGNAGLRRLSTNDYDLVLLDLPLPDMEGQEAARIIRTSPGLAAKAHLPIVGLSSAPAKRQREQSRERGIDAVVQKPLDDAVLLDMIKTLMTRP
ncbi:response regulator [Desulfovibrio sulfodismutans]|uniref:histidine kinase n=3 Tax=Desulfolutivibrio sulfodismutans TaxID=63561 RepID=A0A7K3NQ90_9BACT|nr:response regulator [Desulfolutivibrio sulfodismutans]